MYDLGEFMKGVIQRFALWFNCVHGRKGALWEELFRTARMPRGRRSRFGAGLRPEETLLAPIPASRLARSKSPIALAA
jgi:hypothetical protein